MQDTLDVVDLTVRLMQLDSTSGREGAAMEWLDRHLSERDWRVRRIPVTDGRFDVLATSGDAPAVTLSTHIDTVPPYIPPRLEGDTLWGRGACDAKGIAASMICAGAQLRDRKTPVALLFVVGEEVTHDGAEAANRVPTTSKVLINGEPTESKLASGAKGSQRVILRFRGKAAHSAYPELGKSAIEPMLGLLPTIASLPLPTDKDLGATTVNIGVIRAGTAGNIIPELAEVELMFRLVGDVKPLKKAIEKWVGDAAEIEYGSYIPAQKFETIDGFDVAPVAYTSDIPLLTRWGKPLMFGPGSIHVAHTADEFIAVDELRNAVDAYERIVRALLKS